MKRIASILVLLIVNVCTAQTASAQTNWVWQPMPMVTSAGLDAGFRPGGEGCQYPQIIAIDSDDGSFILYGTDVGGLYRSTNGGMVFQPCNVGIETCGAVGFVIDPKNKNRCLAVGDGGGNQWNIYGGVYLSTNRGASWTRTCSKWLQGFTKGREQIAYDPSSYNGQLGYCKTAYWVEQGNPQETGGRLYRSTDGGSTWAAIAAPALYGGADDAQSLLKIHPKLGYLYIANKNGLYVSTNGGAGFTQALTGDFKSLDVIPSKPDYVWTAKAGTSQIYRSTNAGVTFDAIQASGVLSFRGLKLSPVNPALMLASDAGRNNQRFYSSNGGTNWYACAKDMRFSWIPSNILFDDRNQSHVWHPTDPNTAWCVGPGDIISRATNAGSSLVYANNGNNGIMLGGGFNFNTQNPNILYFGSQDYNGALTKDGGQTWSFINLSINNFDNDPWGWVYGAYAADDKVLFGGNRAYGQSAYQLWITFNGGQSSMAKVDNLTGLQVSYGDPASNSVLFCWAYRSADNGTNWTQMAGCQGVFTHDPSDGSLYGATGSNVVRSVDHGATWATVNTLSANLSDVAVDPINKRLFVVAGNQLWRCDGPGAKPVQISQPNGQANSVAIDGRDTQVIYVAGTAGNWRKFDTCVVRSTDGGKTWEKLNNRTDLKFDGGNCASWCRVHPVTRELWVGTICYGMWRFAPLQPLKTATISRAADSISLSWSGGLPPYVIEGSQSLILPQWTGLATTTMTHLTLPFQSDTHFFRIRNQ